jgi:crotonyl-CoA reductase
VVVKLKSAGLNFNSVWSTLCQPVDAFTLINDHRRRNPLAHDHGQNFAIFGSDGAGIVTEVGSDVKNVRPGDEVVIHCNVVSSADRAHYPDEMLAPSQSIWGYETNFGSFGEYCKVQASQLLPRPRTLSWLESGSYCLTLATAYRMLLSPRGANLQAGETCLIWGAAGGLGSYAIQLARLRGALPIAVVSDQRKAAYCRELGCEVVLNLSELRDRQFMNEDGSPNYLAWREVRLKLKAAGINDIDVVFEHIGKDTLALSIFLLRKGGRVVICAATSGYQCSIDLRYLWMNVKSLIGSHFATSSEAREASELLNTGLIKTCPTTSYDFTAIPQAMDAMHLRQVMGKIAFLVPG